MFNEDLHIGLKQEQILLDKIREKYPCSVQIPAYKGYDLFIPETNDRIEVKYDKMSIQTGNYAIEIEYGGNESGLMTTEADYWIIYDSIHYLMIEPKRIIECILKHRLVYVDMTGKGDSKAKKAFLIKKDILKKYGKIIF